MTQKTYHPQTAKFIATVCENMPEFSGEVMQEWIENPKGLQQVLREALSLDGKTFPTWKTITLGTFKDVKSLKQALKENGFRIGDWASDIMNQPSFSLATEKTDINFVVLSVAELGFSESATYGEICDRARDLALDLCPAEVGPQLRLQYSDQPRGEWITIAMEPISDSGGYPYVFYVRHARGARWLGADWISPDHSWGSARRFVFVSK